MHNQTVTKAANQAAQLMREGLLPQYAIMTAAKGFCIESSAIAKELQHRAVARRALNNRKKIQMMRAV